MDVADRVVLITGASSGVGAALANQLGQMGARVAVNYSRSAEAAEAVVEQITGAGGQALAVQADVSEEADCKRLVAMPRPRTLLRFLTKRRRRRRRKSGTRRRQTPKGS